MGVDTFAATNRAHFIQRLAIFVSGLTANIDAFMKASVDNTRIRLFRVTHKTVLAAFPRRRFFAVVITLDVLIEIGTVAVKNRVVVGRQRKIDSRRFVLSDRRGMKGESGNQRQQRPAHPVFFFSPISRQSFFIKSMSALVRPEAM